jgi:hypothetical protein
MVKKIHYAGEIIWRGGNVLPGWAACCSGDRAIKIAEDGNHTYRKEEVTCKSCLKKIKLHEEFAPEYARIKAQHAV